MNNRIQIDIDPLSDAGAESKLLAQFGPTLHVTRIQLPSSAQYAYRQALYPHLRAGQAIANGSEVCTAGFNLRSSDGNLWDVTAGHCSRGGWQLVCSLSTLPGVSVGPEHSTSRSGSGCDCQCLSAPFPPASRTATVYLAPNSSLAVSSSALKSNVYAGDHVGFSGSAGNTTGYGHVLVGQIQYVDVNHTYSDGSGTFYHMTSVAYPAATDGTPNCTIPGDSGGPWYTLPPSGPNLALGVHSGGSFSCTLAVEYLSPMWQAQDNLERRRPLVYACPVIRCRDYLGPRGSQCSCSGGCGVVAASGPTLHRCKRSRFNRPAPRSKALGGALAQRRPGAVPHPCPISRQDRAQSGHSRSVAWTSRKGATTAVTCGNAGRELPAETRGPEPLTPALQSRKQLCRSTPRTTGRTASTSGRPRGQSTGPGLARPSFSGTQWHPHMPMRVTERHQACGMPARVGLSFGLSCSPPVRASSARYAPARSYLKQRPELRRWGLLRSAAKSTRRNPISTN